MEQLDRDFGELAVSRGLAAREQVEECLGIVEQATNLGAVTSLPDTMIGKGYLSRESADGLVSELKAKTEAPESAGGNGGGKATIPGYELLGKIGRGGMGVVYKARQVAMDRMVAIKVLRPSFGRNKVFLERFFREARVAAKLNHTNVVGAIDAGSAAGYHYFVMEYIDGPTVSEMLQNGPMDEIDALRVTHGVAFALAHAQKFGLIHRDIKPENVMLTSEGIVKLADLGLAKSSTVDMTVTADGSKLGTPYYMSPEQARGASDLDFRSDIYSLGATLFHMVTGRRPFDGDTPAVVVSKRLTQPTPNPQDFRPGISAGLSKLIRRMMNKDPARRYDSVDELIADIETVTAGGTVMTSPTRAAERSASKKTPVGLIAGCSVGAVVLVGVLIFVMQNRETPEQKKGRLAGEALAAATEMLSKSPGDLDGAIAALEKVAVDYSGTHAARNAMDKARELRVEKATQAAAAQIAELKETCSKLAAADRFGEALKRLKAFADTNPPDKMLAEAGKLREGINRKAAQRWLELSQACEAALRENEFDAARAALKPAGAFGIDTLKEDLSAKLAAIDRLEKEGVYRGQWADVEKRVRAMLADENWEGAAAELEKAGELPRELFGAATEQLARAIDDGREAAVARELAKLEAIKEAAAGLQAAFDEQVRPLAAERKYDEAAALLKTLAGQAEYGLAAEHAEALRRDIARLQDFWKEADARAGALRPNTAITVRGKHVTFNGYKNGKISWKIGSAEIAIELTRLSGPEVVELMGGGYPENTDLAMQAAAFAVYDKDCDRTLASKMLSKAPPCPDLERYTIMAGGAYDYGADEQAAENAFAKLIKSATPDNAGKLRAEFFESFGHTRFYNEHLFDLEKLGSREDAVAADSLGIPLLEKEPDLKRALVGCWPLDGTKGGLIPDISGKGNHGRVNGTIAFARGVRGAAARLDKAHVEIPARAGMWPKGSFTIDFCIRAHSLKANYWGSMGPRIVGVGTDRYGYPEKDGGFGLRISPSYISFNLTSGYRYYYGYDEHPIGTEKWYHIAAVLDVDKGQSVIYVNGDAYTSRTTGASFTSFEPLEIGGTRTRRFQGLIDEFHLWAMPLNAEQIAALADGYGLGPGGVTSKVLDENRKAIEAFQEKLTQKITYECSNVPLHYGAVGLLNIAGVPYQWERSGRIAGNLSLKLLSLERTELGAGELLLNLLEPLQLSYDVDADGVVLKPLDGATIVAAPSEEGLIEDKLRGVVTLKVPYPEYREHAPPHQITVPYAVKVILEQVDVPYSFEASVRNIGPTANKWITPNIVEHPCKEALDIILRPELLTYVIRNGRLVLQRQ